VMQLDALVSNGSSGPQVDSEKESSSSMASH
jgi:hypothetical protein